MKLEQYADIYESLHKVIRLLDRLGVAEDPWIMEDLHAAIDRYFRPISTSGSPSIQPADSVGHTDQRPPV